MSETDAFCKEVIRDILGQNAAGTRPQGGRLLVQQHRRNVLLHALSMMQELVEEKGYYLVGGLGQHRVAHRGRPNAHRGPRRAERRI